VITALREPVSRVKVHYIALTSSQLAERSLPGLHVTLHLYFLEVFELGVLLTHIHCFVHVLRVRVSPSSNLLRHFIVFDGRDVWLFSFTLITHYFNFQYLFTFHGLLLDYAVRWFDDQVFKWQPWIMNESHFLQIDTLFLFLVFSFAVLGS